MDINRDHDILNRDAATLAAAFFQREPAALTVTYETRTPVTMRLIGFTIVTRSGRIIPVMAANDGLDWADVQAAERRAIEVAAAAAEAEAR